MPSTSEKQRRFMGMQLAKQRETGHNDTGMSEKQLGEFAHSTKKHGSLNDIVWHEEADKRMGDRLCDEFVHPIHKGYKDDKMGFVPGELDPPDVDGGDPEPFEKGKQSANRDAGQGLHYGAPIDYFGPDTDYRAEEIDVHQYGKDYDPIPFRDYFKTEDKMAERTFRVREQEEYDQTPQPGAVTDDQPMSEAYGAVNFRGAGPDNCDGDEAGSCDYRSFESQQRFARTNKDKSQEYAIDVTGLDTKEGKDIK
jgi:hypothetical protein